MADDRDSGLGEARPVLVDGFMFRSAGHLNLYRDALHILKMVDQLLEITANAEIETWSGLSGDERERRRAQLRTLTARTREPFINVISRLLDETIPYADMTNVVELNPRPRSAFVMTDADIVPFPKNR